jgi:hypothetical protein
MAVEVATSEAKANEGVGLALLMLTLKLCIPSASCK